MRVISKSLLGALIAVLACGALTAASASATPNLPEFKVSPSGSFPVTFTGTSGVVFIHVSNGGTWECQSSSITGEITSTKEVSNVVLHFAKGSGGPDGCAGFCTTGHGTWESKTLKGRIAYLSKTSKKVGVLLEPASGSIFAECFDSYEIAGSVIAEIGPVNRSLTGPSLKYEASTYQQVWRHFEGETTNHGLLQLFEPTHPREFALSDSLSLTMSHAIEILA
jgi:hypothetical protein